MPDDAFQGARLPDIMLQGQGDDGLHHEDKAVLLDLKLALVQINPVGDKKAWEVDPLSCPKCGSEMQVISFITENEVILKIFGRLG